MANKIICRYCAAEFGEMEPKCPYCGSTNYKGAEAEYFDKLEDVREEMEDLEDVPEEEARKEFRKQGQFLKIVFLIIGVIVLIFVGLKLWSDFYFDRDEKQDFLWSKENYPIMDELYAQGKYDELADFYLQAAAEDAPVWSWEHGDFCDAYMSAESLQYLFDKEASGAEMRSGEYISMLFDEMILMGIATSDFDEEERAILAVYEEMARKDFEERWNMSEEEKSFFYDRLEENHGWVEYDYCEDYVEKWYEER